MVSNKEVAIDAVQKIYHGGKNLARGISEGFFCAPTAFRKVDEGDDETLGCYKIGFVPISVILGVLTLPAGYLKLFDYNSNIGLGVLSAHVATHMASGLYEYFRHNKLKIEEKEREVENQSGLEKTVEEPEQPIETEPVETNFIDPWEVKVPKLGGKKNEP